jgi:hypothetical protein
VGNNALDSDHSVEFLCDPSAFSGILNNKCGIILRSVEYLCHPSAFSGILVSSAFSGILVGSFCVQWNYTCVIIMRSVEFYLWGHYAFRGIWCTLAIAIIMCATLIRFL